MSCRIGLLAIATMALAGCGTATVAVTPEKNSPTSISSLTSEPTNAAAGTPTTSATESLTVALTGGLFWQDLTWLGAEQDAASDSAAYNFVPMLAGVEPVISDAALAVCHQETPIAATAQEASGFPSYAVPPEVVDSISATGFDLCTVNSSHTLDHGVAGVATTAKAFDAADIPITGAYSTKQAAAEPLLVTVDGVTVSVVSGTESRGSATMAADQTWVVDSLNAEAMIAKAKKARKAGADIVIAAMNSGKDKVVSPTVRQTKMAEQLTASADIDLVFGHGANVVQPIKKVNGKWVLFGLGNLIAQPPATQSTGFESAIATATFAPSGSGYTVTRLEYRPTTTSVYATGHPIRVQLTSKAIAAGGDATALRESQQRVIDAVGKAEGLTRR